MRIGLVALTACSIAALGGAGPAAAKRVYAGPVPAGWSVDATAFGDLTGDGVPDSVMAIRKIDPAKLIPNSSLGEETLDTNPRRLLIYQRTGSNFRLIASSDGILPSAGSEGTPCLADPLEEGGISIAKNVLTVQLTYWLSCGSYGVATNAFKFRREGTRFRMIGFDRTEFMRSSGQGDKYTINFLTNRMATSPFAIDDSVRERWTWSRIKPQRHYLDTFRIGACVQVVPGLAMC